MNILIAILLGIVEGITEFLPVSSSAHLTLIAQLCSLTDPEIELYAVVVQMGAALAIMWHYRYELIGLLLPHSAPQNSFTGLHGITIYFTATLPAILAGLLIKPFLSYFLAPWSLACFLFLGACFIIYVECKRPRIPIQTQSLDAITYKQAFYVGLFQCLSLLSGFSRSTATIMGATLLGFSRPLAIHFSFLLAIPIMAGATLVKSISLREYLFLNLNDIALSCVVACITSLFSIQYLLTFLERTSFIPFAIYRIILSVILLAILL